MLRDLRQKTRDGGSVNVIPAALALGFEDVTLGRARVGREFLCFAAGGRVVEGVDGCEGVADTGGDVRGAEEACEVRGRRGGEDLLDFLAAREVGEDGGAFDGGAAFEVVAGGPGGGGRVVGG